MGNNVNRYIYSIRDYKLREITVFGVYVRSEWGKVKQIKLSNECIKTINITGFSFNNLYNQNNDSLSNVEDGGYAVCRSYH